MLRLPLDIWHGDNQSFVSEIDSLLKDTCPNKLLSTGQLESMDDNDFALIIRSLSKPSFRERFFPRFDGKHAMTSLMSLIKRKQLIPDDLFGDVAGRIIISIPSEVIEKPEIKKIINSLGNSILKKASHKVIELLEEDIPEVKVNVKTANYVPKTFVIDTGDKKYVPIDTEKQVKQACLYFSKEASTIQPAVYEHAYHKIKNQIEKLGMDSELLPEYKVSNGAKVELLKRASICKDSDKKYYYGLLNNIEKLSALKLASLLDAVDRQTGMIKSWDTRVKSPHRAATENIKLSYYIFSDPSSKNKLTEDDLFKAVSDALICKSIEKYLGDYFVLEFKKAPIDTFKHLPDKYKIIVANIINKKIKPEIQIEVDIKPTSDDRIGSAELDHPKDDPITVLKTSAINSLQDVITKNKPLKKLPTKIDIKKKSKNELNKLINSLITPPGVGK